MPSRAGRVFPTLILTLSLGFVALVAVVLAADQAADHAVALLKASHERELQINEATRISLRSVTDLEADEREYLLTGSPVFLERFESTRSHVPADMARLAELVDDNPVSRDLVVQLSSLVDRWLSEVATPAIESRKRPGAPLAANLLAPDALAYPGQTLLQSSRTLSTQLRAQLRAESEEADRRGMEQRRRARRGIGVAAIAFGLVIFLAGWRATRRLGRDIQRLSQSADRLAAGNYDAVGSAELETAILGRIENALGTASRALKWRETTSRILLTVSREISAAASMSASATALQAAIEQALPRPRLALLWIEEDRRRILATAPEDVRPEGFFDWQPLGSTSIFRPMREARASIVSWKGAAAQYEEDAFVFSRGAVAWAAVPLLIGNRVTGALTIALDEGTFNDTQLRFLETLAQQIAQQLEATALRDSLAQRNEELARATQAKSGFLAMMSHELRTPLNSVIGFSEVLADKKFGPLNDKQARFMRNVLESGRHLLRLINDLLDLSKIEAGRLEVGREPCAVGPLAEAVAMSLQPLAQARRIEVTVDNQPQPAIWADPVRMKQILYNFMSNAVKFTPEGGKVHLFFAHDSHSVRVSVQDNGAGISTDEQARLFQPFNQLHNVKGEGSSLAGTGLGLALARQFATLMQGRVGVDSELGRGSTFWVELPRVDPPEDPSVLEAQGIAKDSPLALVVDDDSAARELTKLSLHAAGYRTAEAASGEQALADARRLRPQLITLDVFLPGMDGWEVLRQLGASADTMEIPVVMLTIANERQKALALGACEHLVKPFDRDELHRAVTESQPSVASAWGKKRLLLVENDATHVPQLEAELQRRGFVVSKATTGAEAIARLSAKQRIDVVLVSLALSDMPAVAIVEALRRDRRHEHLPVVLLAHDLEEDERERLREHVQAICNTSGAPAELARKVGGVVAGLIRRRRV